MVALTVQQGKVESPRPRTSKTTATTPMRWAVRKQTEMAVHISQLSRQETGLACGCFCPACGDTLQAVNAGVPPEHFQLPNTLGQFFRHQNELQRDSCLAAVARLAALQLLVNHHEIDLPAPSRTARLRGISGDVYQAIAFGTRPHLRIHRRVWIDSTTASITLEDGHVILVRLEAEKTVEQDGDVDAVITITIDDPEVASWDAAAVLSKLQLDDGRGICWDKHWTDAELQRTAQHDAEMQASKLLDLVPAALGNLVGLTRAQKSESVLHHAIKSILVNAKYLTSPIHREWVERKMPDGGAQGRRIVFDLGDLALSRARTEQAIGGVVADVHCWAEGDGASFDLMIEVAVTHRVSKAKLEKIAATGIPCLEIDVRSFNKGGRITSAELTHEVLNNEGNKRWLHHPTIDSMVGDAHQSLRRQASQLRHAIESAKRAQQWVESLELKPLLRAFKEALLQQWEGAQLVAVSGHSVDIAALSNRLIALGYQGADQQCLIERNGVLRFLHLTKPKKGGHLKSDDRLSNFMDSLLKSSDGRKLITYCLMSLREFRPMVHREDQNVLDVIRQRVMNSLEAGESTYARTCAFDPLIQALFPSLGKRLKLALGTEAHAESVRKVKQAERDASLAKERAAHAELARKLREDDARKEIQRAVDRVIKKEWA